MAQTLLMTVLTLIGTLGVFRYGPFIAVAVYYFFAVLRPQSLWQWALPDMRWSYYVAIAAIGGAVAAGMGFITPPAEAGYGPHDGRPKLTLSHRMLIAFGAWVCLSYYTAQHPNVAWPWFLEYLKIFVLLLVATLVVRKLEQVWILYLVATVALIYIAYEVNSLYIFQGRLDIQRRGYGGLDNNGAGLMLAMGIPMAIFAWESSRHWLRWGFAAALPLLLHAVLMTFSRGAMVSLIIASPIVLLRSRRRLQFGFVFFLLLLAIPVLAGQEIRARFLTLNEYQSDDSANSRFGSWAAAVRIANDYPMLGVGIRNSNLFSFQYGADMPGRTIHSQYLQILADSGYPALGLYLATIGVMLLAGVRARWRLKGRTDEWARCAITILNGVEGATIVFAVGGAFLSLEVFELPYLILLIGAQTCALVLAETNTVTVPGTRPIAPQPAAGVRPPFVPLPGRVHTSARTGASAAQAPR